MIKFLTLFLGLVSGPQTVHVAVEEPVAAVEIRVGDRVLGRMDRAPFRLDVDLGQDLLPRRLEAVAFDAEGVELGRVAQILNRPRPPAEARVILERDGGGRATAALLSWQSLEGRMPYRVSATFDGQPLDAADPSRVPLPDHDPKSFHFFHARLEFAGGAVAVAQVSFGGTGAEVIGTELTAVPVALAKRGRAPDVRKLSSWFLEGGRAQPVASIEKGPGKVVIVRCSGVQEAIERLEGRISGGYGGVTTTSGASNSGSPNIAPMASSTLGDRERAALALGDEVGLHLLLPRAREVRHRYLGMELFVASPEITPRQGGLYWALTQTVILSGLAEESRIADAVAIAGLQAATGSRRRAVVLIVGADAADGSRYGPAVVREFLRAVDVPLHVWRVGEDLAPLAGWPAATEIADYRDLRRAVEELRRDLERQRIVWLSGRHEPGRLTLAEGAGVGWLTR
ncbi:MAG: hypothetical protein R3325_06215 [Thermoanaerobaculia bacterium]|nr:hypothetical protein [Thermoanaerobaculia bacterium]